MAFLQSPFQSSFFATVGALVAGTISSVALAPQNSAATVFSGGLGAFGASAISESRKQQQKSKKLESDLANFEHQIIKITKQVHAKTLEEQAQQQDEVRKHLVTELNNLKHQIETLRQPRQANPVSAETLKNFYQEYQQALATLETTIINHFDQIEKIIATTAPSPSASESKATGLRTVILYDIENFTKGYNNKNGNVDRVSIQAILDQIRALSCVDEILGQYAYADWSNGSVRRIRQQISELGIKPEQAMNFRLNNDNNNNDKNGRDLQITVDALNLIHQNPLIQCVVIASGDSDFVPLAEKLRFYGKVVVGCAFDNSASKNLRAICHYFIDIPYPENGHAKIEPHSPVPKPKPILLPRPQRVIDPTPTSPPRTPAPEPDNPSEIPAATLSPPQEQIPQPKPATSKRRKRNSSKSSAKVSSPPAPQPSPKKLMPEFEQKFINETSKIPNLDPVAAVGKILEILNTYFDCSPLSQYFQEQGVEISTVERVAHAIIPNLKQIFLPLGLVKFNEYLRFACHDSRFCLAHRDNFLKLFLRNRVSGSFVVQPTPAITPLHSDITYCNILAADFPEFFQGEQWQFKERLPNAVVLKTVAMGLLSIRPDHQDLQSLTQAILLQSIQGISGAEISRGIFVFRSAGVVSIEQNQPPTRYISIVPEIQSLADVHQALSNSLRAKLTPVLGLVGETIDETVLASLLFAV